MVAIDRLRGGIGGKLKVHGAKYGGSEFHDRGHGDGLDADWRIEQAREVEYDALGRTAAESRIVNTQTARGTRKIENAEIRFHIESNFVDCPDRCVRATGESIQLVCDGSPVKVKSVQLGRPARGRDGDEGEEGECEFGSVEHWLGRGFAGSNRW